MVDGGLGTVTPLDVGLRVGGVGLGALPRPVLGTGTVSVGAAGVVARIALGKVLLDGAGHLLRAAQIPQQRLPVFLPRVGEVFIIELQGAEALLRRQGNKLLRQPVHKFLFCHHTFPPLLLAPL